MFDKEELLSIIEDTLKKCADKIRSDIQKSMSDTPLNYERPTYKHNKKIPHYPSLPGNPPAPDSGDLRKSIHWESERNGNMVVARVGTTMLDEKYPIYLEYGTSKMPASKMQHRPWLRPAMKNNAEFVKRELSVAIKNYIGRSL